MCGGRRVPLVCRSNTDHALHLTVGTSLWPWWRLANVGVGWRVFVHHVTCWWWAITKPRARQGGVGGILSLELRGWGEMTWLSIYHSMS